MSTVGFEVSWVQDEDGVWHESPHAPGYVESTAPWTFTTKCRKRIDTATPPLPEAPEAGERCSECASSDAMDG